MGGGGLSVGGGGGAVALHPHPSAAMDLSPQDRAMVRLYMAGCFHEWDQLPGGARRGAAATQHGSGARLEVPARLPALLVRLWLIHASAGSPAELAREYYARGASVAQLRGCVRHMVVFAGYGPCLAATLALHKARLLPEDTPAKVRHASCSSGGVGWGWGRCPPPRRPQSLSGAVTSPCHAAALGGCHPPQVSGPPGNAFELVYGGVTDRVRANMHAADAALGEWIRWACASLCPARSAGAPV